MIIQQILLKESEQCVVLMGREQVGMGGRRQEWAKRMTARTPVRSIARMGVRMTEGMRESMAERVKEGAKAGLNK
eukprot:CAMPEP_0113684628 /NCGR_PEP_ID=MMETSP0038_2-20120614/14128_1 /TAXON_ID=2898 /ORGANISM="Cryptomonas paramecium" /LENGTH=74 /DNA_ID=CAMNT_0000604437 /DNA_START=752 /DNA_END=976 /DNA_ORIENTATION=+ /assembly_acc=CAM_ASM_000170